MTTDSEVPAGPEHTFKVIETAHVRIQGYQTANLSQELLKLAAEQAAELGHVGDFGGLIAWGRWSPDLGPYWNDEFDADDPHCEHIVRYEVDRQYVKVETTI